LHPTRTSYLSVEPMSGYITKDWGRLPISTAEESPPESTYSEATHKTIPIPTTFIPPSSCLNMEHWASTSKVNISRYNFAISRYRGTMVPRGRGLTTSLGFIPIKVSPKLSS
jgi:hypothetical protein